MFEDVQPSKLDETFELLAKALWDATEDSVFPLHLHAVREEFDAYIDLRIEEWFKGHSVIRC